MVIHFITTLILIIITLFEVIANKKEMRDRDKLMVVLSSGDRDVVLNLFYIC